MGAKGTTKNKGRKDALDRFYTKPEVAIELVAELLKGHPGWRSSKLFVEPAAGDGAFVYALEKHGVKNILALDIAPGKCKICKTEILRGDFLAGDIDETIASRASSEDDIIVVGNPPFGEQATLAHAFLEKSLSIASLCALILPPSFHKEAAQRRHKGQGGLAWAIDISDTSYRFAENDVHDVPSAFFAFDAALDFTPLPDHKADLPFAFIPKSRAEDADFIIRRVGGQAGRATKDVHSMSPESCYFCVKKEGCPDDIEDIVSSCTFPERDRSVGPRSLSQKEIAKNVFEQYVEPARNRQERGNK